MNSLPLPTDALVSLCTFRLDGRLFGVKVLDVKEVLTETTATRVPHAPGNVYGLVNIRGQIYLALDLRQLLAIPATPITAESRLVLFKAAVGPPFGVIVDSIEEIRMISTAHMEPFTAPACDANGDNPVPRELIESICKFDNELLLLLNPRRFLPRIEHELAMSFRGTAPIAESPFSLMK